METPMAMSCDKDGMPPVLRALLEDSEQPQMVDRQVSVDGTRKYILRLHDGALIEMVAMPHVKDGVPGHLSVCYSTQVGCAMGCAFCATGRQGFTRNLDAAEMVWQLVIVEEDFGRPIDVAVAMGQGEPLANCMALIEALKVIADPEGLGVPEDKLVISTSGPVAGIRKFAESPVAATLSISLHAVRQELRDELMPGVRSVPLEVLHEELERFNERTGRFVDVEYLMLGGVNDSVAELHALVEFCRGLDARIVLLHYNADEGMEFKPSTFGTTVYWSLYLRQQGFRVLVIQPLGTDVHAGCGMLRNRFVAGGAGSE